MGAGCASTGRELDRVHIHDACSNVGCAVRRSFAHVDIFFGPIDISDHRVRRQAVCFGQRRRHQRVNEKSRVPGAPGIDFGTWENLLSNKPSVPHPCDFFLSQGWEATNAGNLNSRVPQVSILRPGITQPIICWRTPRLRPPLPCSKLPLPRRSVCGGRRALHRRLH